jgi:hypothetical protein
MGWQRNVELKVGLVLMMAGSPLVAWAQAPEGQEPEEPPVQGATVEPPAAEPAPPQTPSQYFTQAKALRDEARTERDRLTSNPDLQREYIVYQYTGDEKLAPRVAEVIKRADKAEKQARELEQRAFLPPASGY